MRTALRLSGNRARAEDAVQETYLRAWRSFQPIRRDTNCRAWLFKILLNVLKKTTGKKRRDSLLGAEDIETSSKVVSLFPASGEERGEGQDILAAVNQLPPSFGRCYGSLWLKDLPIKKPPRCSIFQ